jgi:MarR family transcriptional regulator, negative regulator of the multidrug operon emrRAB
LPPRTAASKRPSTSPKVSQRDYVANIFGALSSALNDEISRRTVAAAEHGPSAPAAVVTLRFTPGIAVERLAQTIGISVPGVVQLLNRLEAAGLIDREVGSDRRRRHLSLTPAGKRLAEEVLLARREVIDLALGRLKASERQQFGALVEQMLTGFSGTRPLADKICRLCDERACPDDRCPSELALPAELRVGTLAP